MMTCIAGGPAAQDVEGLIDGHPAEIQGVGELVENNEVVAPGEDGRLAGLPLLQGEGLGMVHVLGEPRESVAVGDDGDAEPFGGPLLAEAGAGLLEELEHSHTHVPAPCAEEHAEGRGGLAPCHRRC